MQDARQQEGQMQLEALLRSRDQEVSSLSHRYERYDMFCNKQLHSLAAYALQFLEFVGANSLQSKPCFCLPLVFLARE